MPWRKAKESNIRKRVLARYYPYYYCSKFLLFTYIQRSLHAASPAQAAGAAPVFLMRAISYCMSSFSIAADLNSISIP